MKHYIMFSFLLASLIPHSHAMQCGNLSYTQEFELERKEAQDAMTKLNIYLDLNKSNSEVEKIAVDAFGTKAIIKTKYYWYDAKPMIHAKIACELAKTKAKHAAKLFCERQQNLVKNPSPANRNHHTALSTNDSDLQALWINAELNLATIKRFEESFQEQARLEEKRRNAILH